MSGRGFTNVGAQHVAPLEFLHLLMSQRRRSVSIGLGSSPRQQPSGLFGGGFAPQGPRDHSARLEPWVSGDPFREALKGATQLSLGTSGHPHKGCAYPAPMREGQELLVSPFQGWKVVGGPGPWVSASPAPRANIRRRFAARPGAITSADPPSPHWRGCHLENVETLVPGLARGWAQHATPAGAVSRPATSPIVRLLSSLSFPL